MCSHVTLILKSSWTFYFLSKTLSYHRNNNSKVNHIIAAIKCYGCNSAEFIISYFLLSYVTDHNHGNHAVQFIISFYKITKRSFKVFVELFTYLYEQSLEYNNENPGLKHRIVCTKISWNSV